MTKLFTSTVVEGLFSAAVILLIIAPSVAYPAMLALGTLHLHASPSVPAWGWWTTYVITVGGLALLDGVRMMLGPDDK